MDDPSSCIKVNQLTCDLPFVLNSFSDKYFLPAALDTGRVVIDVSSKFSQGLPQQHSSPLRCHVWAYSDPATQKSSQCKDELFITGDTGELSKAMLE